MSIRIFLCGTMGVFSTMFDDPLSMFIGGPISIDVVVLGKVINKGALCEVESKGQMLAIPMVETSLWIFLLLYHV